MAKRKAGKGPGKAKSTATTNYFNTHKVGDVVVIRGIPFHYIGKISAMGEHTVTLAAGAVWLADSERWGSTFLKEGKVREAEPYMDPVEIGYGVIADITKWRHDIPGQV